MPKYIVLRGVHGVVLGYDIVSFKLAKVAVLFATGIPFMFSFTKLCFVLHDI